MCSIDSTYDIIINSFITIDGNGYKINFLNFGNGASGFKFGEIRNENDLNYNIS